MNNKEEDVFEIDLLQVFDVIKKNLLLFIAICILTCTAGFAYSKFYLSETFTATSKIIIVKDESSSTTSSAVTVNDVNLSQKLVSTYTQILKSETISDEVISNLGLINKGIDTKKYDDMVNITSADSTEVMSIKVTSTDPELSALMANEIVDVFISKIYGIMKIQNVTVLDTAKVPTVKSGPSVSKYTAIGGVLGLVICALIAIIKILTDTKVKTEEEVKAIFDYPIIGNIPDFLDKEIEYDD